MNKTKAVFLTIAIMLAVLAGCFALLIFAMLCIAYPVVIISFYIIIAVCVLCFAFLHIYYDLIKTKEEQ